MPKAIQKILRQGNSAMITIPRAMMFALEWLPGELIALEVIEPGVLVMRPFKTTEMAQGQSPGIIVDPPPAVRP